MDQNYLSWYEHFDLSWYEAQLFIAVIFVFVAVIEDLSWKVPPLHRVHSPFGELEHFDKLCGCLMRCQQIFGTGVQHRKQHFAAGALLPGHLLKGTSRKTKHAGIPDDVFLFDHTNL